MFRKTDVYEILEKAGVCYIDLNKSDCELFLSISCLISYYVITVTHILSLRTLYLIPSSFNKSTDAIASSSVSSFTSPLFSSE